VLTLLIGPFAVSLPLLKVDILGCVAINGAPLYSTALVGGICSGCLGPALLVGMGHLVQLGFFVGGQSPAPSACRAGLRARIELCG
jgi:hypothetical protein